MQNLKKHWMRLRYNVYLVEIDVHGYCVREGLKETFFRTKPLISDLKGTVFFLYPENFQFFLEEYHQQWSDMSSCLIYGLCFIAFLNNSRKKSGQEALQKVQEADPRIGPKKRFQSFPQNLNVLFAKGQRCTIQQNKTFGIRGNSAILK